MQIPLADKLRPQTINDMVGQQHLLDKGKPLRNIIESGSIPNLIFYGPSGTGKTTVARIIANKTNRTLKHLNCTTAGTADIKAIIKEIDSNKNSDGILLYLDEIQYFNKKQQQTLLEYIENGSITLIASTTENPYFYVYSAILSRSSVFEFKNINASDIENIITKGFTFLANETNQRIEVEDTVIPYIAKTCGGDVRKSLNNVELSFLATKLNADNKKIITLNNVENLIPKNIVHYDRDGDEHYDLLSAFQKSMRGSDPDAAIYYLARLLDVGDMPSVIRRLLVCATEDVGLAYPQLLPIVKSACDIALQVGMPEARLPLAEAVILVATSPKSNTAHDAINKAMSDIKNGCAYSPPRHLQNNHFDGSDVKNKGQFYNYPHDHPNHWVEQQYLPDNLKNKAYYNFGENKQEQAAKVYWDNIKKTNNK
jgi:putative ATPase